MDPTMAIPYSTSMNVVESWDMIKRDKYWMKNFGGILADNFFKVSPMSLTLLFSFGVQGERMKESPAYSETAEEAARVLDLIVSSLGADTELLRFQLANMTSENKDFRRIRPEHWAKISAALMTSLESALGDRFDAEWRESWEDAFEFVSQLLIQTLKQP